MVSHYYKMVVVRALRTRKIETQELYFSTPDSMQSKHMGKPVLCRMQEPLVYAVYQISDREMPKGDLVVYIFGTTEEELNGSQYSAMTQRVAVLADAGRWPDPANTRYRKGVQDRRGANSNSKDIPRLDVKVKERRPRVSRPKKY